jgi:hypothetical protein
MRQAAKTFFNFFRTEFLCRLSLLAGGKGFFLFFLGQKFFADCLDWQVANDFFNFFQNRNSLPTVFIGWWQRILCRLP